MKEPQHVYARHAPARTWCIVDRIENGSAVTACRGRWPVNDKPDITLWPDDAERCDECVRVKGAK